MADALGIVRALSALRVPLQKGEYDLHALVMQTLEAADIPYAHEVPIEAHARIDLLCGDVGIEIKRGSVRRADVLRQLRRYAASEKIAALIVVSERTLALPATLSGKPLYAVCLNRLWGIAL